MVAAAAVAEGFAARKTETVEWSAEPQLAFGLSLDTLHVEGGNGTFATDR